MKNIILLIVVLPFFLCSQSYNHKSKSVYIDKNNEGFNIYNSQGELLHEFTLKNCDSLTMEMLNDIFSKSDSNGRREFAVINLQEKRFDWTGVLIALTGIIGTILGGYFTNKWATKSQLEHYKKTLKIESTQEWIVSLQNSIAEIVLSSYDLYHQRQYLKTQEELLENKEDFQKAADILLNKMNKPRGNIEFQLVKLTSLLSDSKKEKMLLLQVRFLSLSVQHDSKVVIINENEIKIETPTTHSKEKEYFIGYEEMHKKIDEIRNLLSEIIKEKQIDTTYHL